MPHRIVNYGMISSLPATKPWSSPNVATIHAIIYEFAPTGKPKIMEDPPSQIILCKARGKNLDITKWKNTTAAKYLEAHKCPSNQTQQFWALKKKCYNFGRIIHCSHLTRRETQCFYWAIYCLSANYVLPTSALHGLQAPQRYPHRGATLINLFSTYF